MNISGTWNTLTRTMSTSIKHSTNNKIAFLCCLAPVVVFDDTSIFWQKPYAARPFSWIVCTTTPIQHYTRLDKLNNKFTLYERNNLTLYALISVLNLWCNLSNWAETFRIYIKYVGAIERQLQQEKSNKWHFPLAYRNLNFSGKSVLSSEWRRHLEAFQEISRKSTFFDRMKTFRAVQFSVLSHFACMHFALEYAGKRPSKEVSE